MAKTVGWTAAQGMAGLGSQQQLMNKLGIGRNGPGPQWDKFASEAQTGNPVTIPPPPTTSTPTATTPRLASTTSVSRAPTSRVVASG